MSNLPAHQPNKLQQIIDVAERELQSTDTTPFSPAAFERLKEKISEYTAQIITESVKTARRRQSDSVSTSDVEHASLYLVSTTSRKVYKHIGTVGGLLLGAAVSNVISMVTTNQFNLNGIVLTVIFTLIGAALVAAHMVKD